MTTVEKILLYVTEHPLSSSLEIFEGAGVEVSYATVRREIAKLVADNSLLVTGNRKSSRYSVSPICALLQEIDIATYFEREIDDRHIVEGYNFELIDTLAM
ncbi:MAG: cell filamentation protein Fic, partial [Rikenellaceae bacterium]